MHAIVTSPSDGSCAQRSTTVGNCSLRLPQRQTSFCTHDPSDFAGRQPYELSDTFLSSTYLTRLSVDTLAVAVSHYRRYLQLQLWPRYASLDPIRPGDI
jgi:hypothetical protein